MTEEIHLETAWQHTRGVIGRYPDPDQEFVFEFDTIRKRGIHMIGVTRPLEVSWYVGGNAVATKTLRPWRGFGRYRCDRIVERRPHSVG